MPPLYEALFSFSAPHGHLAQIKRLDPPANTTKAQVNQWLWIEAGTVTTLQFVAMDATDRQRRTFKEASLWFDDTHGELRWEFGAPVALRAQSTSHLPEGLAHLVNLHLS